MRRTLRRAALALAVGAGLGLAGMAAAQPPATALSSSRSFFSDEQPSQMTYQRIHGGIGEDRPTSDLTAIELAWLADPATFPFVLAARVEGQALQVRGYV